MVSKRKPEEKPFDVDGFLRDRDQRSMTDAELDAVLRKAAAEPGIAEALDEADRMHDAWRKEATDSSAVHRSGRAGRKRSA